MNDIVESIVACMAAGDNGMSEIQRIQTEHRLKLAQFWGISEGSRVLEVGCGQGDTTAVLAHLVGPYGLIYGIDVASPNYGAPITVGDAADFLMSSKLGRQIQMHYDTNILSPDVDFKEHYFDTVVFSHSSWYLKSAEEFLALLTKVRKFGKRLAYGEWDLRIQGLDQLPHLLAVIVQGQYESFKEHSFANVRTLFTVADVRRLAAQAGWSVEREHVFASHSLQDGNWEVAETRTGYQTELQQIPQMPEKLKSLIRSEVGLMEFLISEERIKPMNVYAFVAE
jgi:SAM-dependent methyltransferase